MSELRERMSHAMCLRGMAARPQEAYIGALVELAKIDIESTADRLCKGGKDRYTLLSPRRLAVLRTYWRDTRPR